MKKSSISYLLMATLLLGTVVITNAQEADAPMWETIVLTPDNTKLKVLSENMRAHNQKYHKEGPHKATVYQISSGPDIGKIVWMMGPLKFAHLDSRPSAGGHDEDWRDNVMAYVKKMQHGEYWKGDVKLSNTDMLTDDPSLYPIQFIRYWEVNLEHSHNAEGMLTIISKTIKAMEGNNAWGVYYNQFRQGTRIGRHIATVGFYKNWAELDEAPTFKKTFLKVHGEDSWDAFVRNMDQVMDNSWDEIWVYDKELSGD
jgi:hypothetical protein